MGVLTVTVMVAGLTARSASFGCGVLKLQPPGPSRSGVVAANAPLKIPKSRARSKVSERWRECTVILFTSFPVGARQYKEGAAIQRGRGNTKRARQAAPLQENRIVCIPVPVLRVVVDVASRFVQDQFVPDDMLVIAALP